MHTKAQAIKLLALHPLFLDSETTGLDGQAELCDLAIIDAAGNILIDTLLRPTCPIPADATAIHGISNDDIAEAPNILQLWPTLAAILADTSRPIIAYNADFDRRLILQSAQAHGLEASATDAALRTHLHCAMLLYAEHYGDWNDYRRSYRWQTLANACRQQQIQVTGLHRARADAEACRRLLLAIAGTPDDGDTQPPYQELRF